jgi:hypothetical protein
MLILDKIKALFSSQETKPVDQEEQKTAEKFDEKQVESQKKAEEVTPPTR